MVTAKPKQPKKRAKKASAKRTAKKAPSKKRAPKKASAKAKRAPKKASGKRTPKKASAKRTPNKASAKRTPKKASAKRTPKKASAKRTPKKAAKARKASAKKASVKKPVKKATPKKASAKRSVKKVSKNKAVTRTNKAGTTRTVNKVTDPKKSLKASSTSSSEQVSDKQNVTAPSATRSAGTPVADEGAVLVTGICGRLGKLVARKLHRKGPVIGIDRRPFEGKPKDISHYQLDVRRSKTRDIFRRENISAVVHLGTLHNPRVSDRERHSWNVVAFQKLLEFLRQYDVPKLVVLSSANVYGPQPNNPQFLTEDAPLLGSQEFQSIRDLVELDMLAQGFFWKHPETETVILRPCHILGGVRNAASNYLRLERPVTVMGFDPMVQPIHERDVVEAISLALRPGVRGIFNLRGPGELPLSRVLKELGRRPRSVPGPLARMALDRMWRMRLTSFPAPELDHIRYLCMVDDQRARTELGFKPKYDLQQTLGAVTSER